MSRLSSAVLLVALALGACTSAPPSKPGVLATAGKDKTVAAFHQDDADCRQVAAQKVAAESSTPPAEGAPPAAPVVGSPQQRYDASYAQCMCAKGDSIVARGSLIAISFMSSIGMVGGVGSGGGHR